MRPENFFMNMMRHMAHDTASDARATAESLIKRCAEGVDGRAASDDGKPLIAFALHHLSNRTIHIGHGDLCYLSEQAKKLLPYAYPEHTGLSHALSRLSRRMPAASIAEIYGQLLLNWNLCPSGQSISLGSSTTTFRLAAMLAHHQHWTLGPWAKDGLSSIVQALKASN